MGPHHGNALPEAEWNTAYGETTCGNDCVSAYGRTACAQWPGGACRAAYGNIVCGPAPPYGWEAWWSAGQNATCEDAFGKVACGFHCVTGYGEVACAQTPQGSCEAAYGRVTCWDPPR